MPKETELAALRQENDDLRSGRTFHVHNPRSGNPAFRCCSPYCDDMGADDPAGPPPLYAPAPRYRRDA